MAGYGTKLRCVLWRPWKRPHARARHLMHGACWKSGHGARRAINAARGGTRARATCTRPSRSPGSTIWGWCRRSIRCSASSVLHEPPYAEPHVRWCGRATGVTRSLTRSWDGPQPPRPARRYAAPRGGAVRLRAGGGGPASPHPKARARRSAPVASSRTAPGSCGTRQSRSPRRIARRACRGGCSPSGRW